MPRETGRLKGHCARDAGPLAPCPHSPTGSALGANARTSVGSASLESLP